MKIAQQNRIVLYVVPLIIHLRQVGNRKNNFNVNCQFYLIAAHIMCTCYCCNKMRYKKHVAKSIS